MRRVRVLVIDQQPLFSRGLELLLPELSGGRVRVAASTGTVEVATGLVQRHRPDLVLVDLDLPPSGGVRAISAVRRADDRLPILAMVTAQDDAATLDALRAGAHGLLVKTREPEELLSPLLAAADGCAVLPLLTLARLAEGCTHPSPPPLSPDQRQLWALIASGLGTTAIAARLHVSDRTVKRLTAALLRQLGVTTRTHAAALAGRSGVLDPYRGEPV